MWSVTGAPLACARPRGVTRVIPVPATGSPETCARVSGWVTVMGEEPRLPTAAMVAVSEAAPLPTVMECPGMKPTALATGIAVAPVAMAVPTVVAPGVPTVAITAVS